ncbi:immune inhibitor A domain-containing protein [Alkalihalobacillus sp. AL-G]|uniref:immune inhibitor A domain-containing protein n=1 Tax=Alkalihalobacillus sp. AL-G TaxID=2926399 RepID=UPI00272D143A|nr:immune inhibitor A domain-containing protein [Alkalihalobacillus sp. AL-G]WLD93137.1 immune inhibitor A [Alkalihalobacillus sp. AL-G]
MKKRKLVSTAMAVAMGLSTLAMGAFSPAANADAEAALSSVKSSYGAPIDLGIANDERLIEMLKENGTIAEDATPAEAEKALKKYLKERSANGGKDKGELADERQKTINALKEKASENGLTSGKGNKLGQADEVTPVEEEDWNGSQRVDNVLVLLIEYPDFVADNIQSGETDMYYEEYPTSHYQDMIFGGEDGYYTGPDGEKLISVREYYEQQSGGSYSIQGTVAGWYTAKKPAAFYGNNADGDARALVKEALLAAANDPTVDLSQFDQEDRYDLNGNGDYREPDGLIDHLMVVHSSVGEEAGGGQLGEDAVWSHRWSLAGPTTLPGTEAEVPYWGGTLAAYDYTIEPADGAAGVFAHEYGHDLGLPDEYDTVYSGAGEPVSYWSIMSSGSWAGTIPGTEPTGFSPYAREFLHNSMPDSNWLTGTTINANDVTSEGTTVLLDQANSKGTNNDAVRVDLPEKATVINTPAAGSYEYHSGKGDEIDHKMVTSVDLTNATNATLDYDAWYNIESNWDFAMVQVSTDDGATWESLTTPNTSSDIVSDGYPAIKENLPGYTGSSNGWIHESIDLSNYAGQAILVQFRYMTDWGTNLNGLYVDNINVTVDGAQVLNDGAETNESPFNFGGFVKDDGQFTSNHYYLLEWRSHNGVDQGLAHISRGDSIMSHNQGLVVWYVDESYDNNWTGVHPGDGFLGIVDADQHANYWSDKAVGSTRYQVHDAAFSLNKSEKMFLDYPGQFTMKDNFTKRNPLFDDSADWSNPGLVDAGRNVPEYGLKFRVVGQSDDMTVGKVLIFK